MTATSPKSSDRPHLMLVAEPLDVGEVLDGKYEIEGILAEGGMGVVYRARQRDLDIPVAVKLIRPELIGDEASMQRFLREARMAALLRSPHAARVFDFGRLPGGSPYLVMELLEGQDLAELLREQGPASIAFAARSVIEASLALSDAHALGIVHRDLKPENLFLARQHDGTTMIKVVDFGIAKLIRDSGGRAITLRGAIGSPSYMAPEQMRYPDQIDARSDVWALGAVLFELLTARPAFEGNTIAEVCAKVLSEPPPHVSWLRVDVPLELDAIIDRCLAREPDQRFSSVRELADALRPFAGIPSVLPVTSAPLLEARDTVPSAPIERAFFDSEPPPELAFDRGSEPIVVPVKPRWPWALATTGIAIALAAVLLAVTPRSLWSPLYASAFAEPALLPDSDEIEATSSWTPQPPLVALPVAVNQASETVSPEPTLAPAPSAPAPAPATAMRRVIRPRPSAIPRASRPVPSETPRPTLSVPSFDDPSNRSRPVEAPPANPPETQPYTPEEP